MAVGKNSIKRAAAATGNENSSPAKKPAVKKAAKNAGAVETKEVKAAVEAKPAHAAVKAVKEKLSVDQAGGVNAHYGVNTPLPTFLL